MVLADVKSPSALLVSLVVVMVSVPFRSFTTIYLYKY